MISASHLVHVYGTVQALRDVSFEIPKGQIVGLVGPNGAGKTTTMKVLTGYLVPTGGSASIAGHDIVTDRLAAQRRIGYLPENAPIYRDLSVQEYLMLVARLREVPPADRVARISSAVHACGLEEVLTRPVGHLSKGFRQRTGLAQALLHDPDILILDEPTSGLDPTQILEIREMIRRMGEQKTVILSTHILSEVESTCHRAVMIVAGRIHVDQDLESFRRGHGIVVRIKGTPEGAAERLSSLDGVERVTPIEDRDGNTSFHLDTDARKGLLTGIGSLAHDAGWTLTELRREHHDLEDVFKQLRDSQEVAA